MLLPRFLTALFGLPLLIAAIVWGQFPFALVVLAIVMLALYEYYNLLEQANVPVFKWIGLVCGAFFSIGIALFGSALSTLRESPVKSAGAPFICAILLFVFSFFVFFCRQKENAFVGLAAMWFGNFYVVWTLSHLILLRDLKPNGLLFTLFLFLLIWALDIGAYIGGIRWGKRKMSEISPKKTWEGSAIGTFAALGVAWGCQISFKNFIDLKSALGLASLVVIGAQVSDLSESLFKRNMGVKDSGALLPGHGGILDRFDSFLLVTPLYYYAIIFFIGG